ncbi:eukaryotic translation initiation factor 2A [Phlebotomus papatasi]|uniref:Eukaryotic translation initiation factor 2A n=1 Tax=Phlebotomus papatasi TaxID=29031 RepID=A0A1B0DCV7_PHLPP|nr:eukaryotic translation initiation factor 2A [Phlebotomus papatasi]
MASAEEFPALAIRSSVGVELWATSKNEFPYVPYEKFPRDDSKHCRALEYSPDGRFLAWGNGAKVQLCRTSDWEVIASLPRPKAFYLKFSPRGKYLMTWEIYAITKDNPEGSPNLYVYSTETGEEVYSTVQKKQADWEPGWSSDESIFAVMLGGEVLFYEVNGPEGFRSSTRKLGGGRNGCISVAPNTGQPYLAFYVPGTKGSPSMCKIYQYPTLSPTQAISSKSFFQADKVEMMWNKRGTGLLLLTSTDVDQTNASYYGKQALHFMSTKGDSFAVQLSKEGPIHAVSWSPKSTEFIVVYGFMPSKATLFNLKCDAVFEFGESPRNSIYFNDFGNLVLLAGFGNLRGNVECWHLGKERKCISTLQAPDSTLLEWNPNGEIFMTATTAPRLRQSNGFKVWHYTGALLHETMWPKEQELLEVRWQKFHHGVFKEKPVTGEKVVGIQSAQPQASAQVYRPPAARGLPMKAFDLYSDSVSRSTIPGLPPGMMAKNENKKKRTNAKAQHKQRPGQQKTEGRKGQGEGTTADNSGQVTQDGDHERRSNGHRFTTGDPQKDRKIQKIQKKLYDITKLKEKKKSGEALKDTQLAKIDSEASLIKELQSLTIVA